jgi:hypothetical protein
LPRLLDRDRIAREFDEVVNMTADEIEQWLGTGSSAGVGWKGADGSASESVGHRSGRHIVQILRSRRSDRDDADYAHMRKVVGFVRRHLAQRPENVVTSRWRYALMNWGHDPLKEET